MSLEEISSGDEAAVTGGADAEAGRSRGETKARKALSKLGLKKIEGINRVVLRRPKGVLFVVAQPEVFKGNGDCYIVFGEAKIEDANALGFQNQLAQAQEIERAQALAEARQSATIKPVEEDDGDVDETGLNSADIDVVVAQASCSRGRAAKALKATDGDIVQAILDATS